MASLFRLRRGWQSATLLPRSEWNLLPQHRVMLPPEHAIENYIFPLVHAPHRRHPNTRVNTRCTNSNVSATAHDGLGLGVYLIERCNWNRVRRSLRFLERLKSQLGEDGQIEISVNDTGPGLPWARPTRYLMLSLLRNQKAAVWAWQSASRSLNRMVAGSGLTPMAGVAHPSASPCPRHPRRQTSLGTLRNCIRRPSVRLIETCNVLSGG